jgi:LysM repeat protein
MKTRNAFAWGVVGLVMALALAGCLCPPTKSALPTVMATAVGAQEAPSDEGALATAMIGTAAARATQTAQASGLEMADETPVSPLITPTLPSSTVPPATESPTTIPATAVPAPTTAPAAGEITYVVQRGDTLYSIARRYSTTVEAIASANGIANPGLIRAGQTLKISTSGTPPSTPAGGTTYVVQPGDNLFRIALRYGLSYVYLAQYNGISDPSRIYVGQVIRIPPR